MYLHFETHKPHNLLKINSQNIITVVKHMCVVERVMKKKHLEYELHYITTI